MCSRGTGSLFAAIFGNALRFHHYAFRTKKSYSERILGFIRFIHCKRHPKDLQGTFNLSPSLFVFSQSGFVATHFAM